MLRMLAIGCVAFGIASSSAFAFAQPVPRELKVFSSRRSPGWVRLVTPTHVVSFCGERASTTGRCIAYDRARIEGTHYIEVVESVGTWSARLPLVLDESVDGITVRVDRERVEVMLERLPPTGLIFECGDSDGGFLRNDGLAAVALTLVRGAALADIEPWSAVYGQWEWVPTVDLGVLTAIADWELSPGTRVPVQLITPRPIGTYRVVVESRSRTVQRDAVFTVLERFRWASVRR